MLPAARLLLLLSGIVPLASCRNPTGPVSTGAKPPAAAPAGPLAVSARVLVGRILAVDTQLGLAYVELTAEPPAAALLAGANLQARTDDLRETARLRASRYTRGRVLSVQIVSGQPARGDEVVVQNP
jgi:hypothetical protein